MKWNLVDVPDGERKVHARPIPRIGGIPIAISYLGAIAAMLAFAPNGAQIAVQHQDLLWSLLPAAGIVFLTGVIDDLITIRPWQKLGGQLLGAVWAVLMGVRITSFNGHPETEWLSIPLSILWLVGCTNAFNLIDGLDGLASGVGLFATLTTLLAAILQGNWGLAMATVPLAGCLLAFLRYNFNPASVFLGDSGSLTIGFMLGCFGVIWSQKSATLLGMVAPVMALALPLMDVGLSIGRRFLRNQPIFQPDRGHIHHRLLALGFKTRDVALILYVVCGIAAALSLLQSSLSFHLGGLIIILFCALSWIGIQRLEYVEFATAKRILKQGNLLRVFHQEIFLEHFRDAVTEARTKTEFWRAVRSACLELGFVSMSLTLDGETFQEVFHAGQTEPSWQVSFSLRKQGQLSLTRAFQNKPSPAITSFLHILQECADAKNFVSEMPIAACVNGPATVRPAKMFHKLSKSSVVNELDVH